MKVGTALRVLMLIGVAAVMTAALSLAVTATASMPWPDRARAPDTTTVGRLSGGWAADDGERVQATTAISDAAWLAGELLSTVEIEINLPLVER